MFLGFSDGGTQSLQYMAKKKTVKQHKDRIDRVFHEWIRRRDVDNNTGMGICVTCKKKLAYKGSNAGHFRGRQHMATRWDERNVNLQCVPCNNWGGGEAYLYSLHLGEELSNELLRLSRTVKKFTDSEYLELYDYYNTKLKELKEIQNF